MKNFLRHLLNIFLPPRCICCGEVLSEGNGLCPKCFSSVKFITKPYCAICGAPLENPLDEKDIVCGKCLKDKRHYFSLQRSAFIYDENSKHMLINLKFHDKTSYAPVLAKFLHKAAFDILKENPDIIVPVPLHYMRLLKRKYNQSSLLAHELSNLCNIPVDDFSLKRCKNTTPQVEFSGKARIKNVRGAFAVKNPKNIKNKKVLLIDDVMTTGSTLKECAIALKKAGAAKIYALTVARTEHK